jgi:quinol monooxygenase YgiN
MAIGVFATLKVKEGQEQAFEAVFTELAKAVRANEPGNTLYQLVRSRTEKGAYHVMEIYKDDAALAAHRGADHFKAAGPKLAPCMAGAPQVQVFDTVG